jgi:ribonuclease HII
MEDLHKYELELNNLGINYIAGIDEVGRGPLVGPVVSACVVLPKGYHLEGLNDSKQLSEKKRDLFFDIIMENALGVGVGIVSPEKIDEINIYQASKEAMMIAINECMNKCKIEHILIDAMKLELPVPSTSIIKGDAKSITIAASSVIAKVTRDKMMYELNEKYPMYGFDKHKGYPTKSHIEALEKYGLIDGYRKTYKPVMNILEKANNT